MQQDDIGLATAPTRASDTRTSHAFRRASWYGSKKWVKRALALPPINLPLAALRWLSPDATRFHRLPVARREIRGVVHGRDFVMLDPMRCAIAKELYWGRGRRCDPAERFALDLFVQLAGDVDVVLDVGANTGIFTIAAAVVHPHLRVHAFEIVPEIFELLYRNVVRNDLLTSVRCHHYGLGEDGATMVVPETFGASSLPTSISSEMHFDAGVTVPFVSLDSIASLVPEGSEVLVKIDVEGTEDRIFAAASEFVAARRTHFLCEILPRAADPERVDGFLRERGYHLFMIGPDFLQPAARVRPDPRHRDWLFTPKSPAELARIVPVRDDDRR